MNEIPQSPADMVERILRTARAALPDSLSEDMRDTVKAALQDVITELDIVTREEMETQNNVLQKTRAKVDHMEQIIADLESRLDLS